MEKLAKKKLFAAATRGRKKDWKKCLALSKGMKPSELVHVVNTRDETPLNVAVAHNRISMVWLFLKHGADINARGQSTSRYVCLSPLEQALSNRNEELAEAFLDAGAKVNDSRAKTSALHFAIRNNMSHIAQRLIHMGADVNSKDRDQETPLSCALHYRERSIASLLMENGANVDAIGLFGSSLLMRFLTDEWALNELLKRGANPNFSAPPNERLPLHIACVYGMKDKILLLLNHGADTETWSNGMTPLFIASQRGKLWLVQLLLEHGADVNGKSNFGKKVGGLKNHGYFALHIAVKNGHDDIVDVLLGYGADTNVRNWRGETPVFEAVKQGNIFMINRLVDGGADLCVVNVFGWTLCHCACLNGHLDIFNYLVESGVDWRSKDCEGDTCLHTAAEGGHLALVELLMKKGIDDMTKNDAGMFPIMMASAHVDVVHYLVRHMTFTCLLRG